MIKKININYVNETERYILNCVEIGLKENVQL